MRTVQALLVDEALWAGLSGTMSISLEYFLGTVAVYTWALIIWHGKIFIPLWVFQE